MLILYCVAALVDSLIVLNIEPRTEPIVAGKSTESNHVGCYVQILCRQGVRTTKSDRIRLAVTYTLDLSLEYGVSLFLKGDRCTTHQKARKDARPDS